MAGAVGAGTDTASWMHGRGCKVGSGKGYWREKADRRVKYLTGGVRDCLIGEHLTPSEVNMGILSEQRVAKLGSHTIEVRGKNHFFRGLIYTLFFDGVEVASAQNFFKLPTRRSLEARV